MPLDTMEDLYEVKFCDSIQKNGELQGQIVFLKAKNSKSEELLKVGQDKELKLSKQLSDLILENDKHQKDLETKAKEYQIELSKNKLTLEKYIADVGNMQEEVKTTKQKYELIESELNTTTIKYNNLQKEFETLQKRYELCEEKVKFCVANHSNLDNSKSGGSGSAASSPSKIPPPPSTKHDAALEAKLEELSEENERLKGENQEKDSTIQNLQAIIEDLTLKMQNYADQNDELIRRSAEQSDKPKVNELQKAKKNVEHAVKAVMERKTQFQEIRRYDVIPKQPAIITIVCCLHLLNHDVDVNNSQLTQAQWNYVRNFFKYSLVVEISEYNIMDKLEDEEVAEKISIIRENLTKCNGKEVYSASSAIGAIYDWLNGLIGLYDTAIHEKELMS